MLPCYADEQSRDSVADRVARHRETKLKRDCNDDVTEGSQKKNKNRQEEEENKTDGASPSGESGGVESSDEVKSSKPRKAKASPDEDPDFETFWIAYPRKVAKPKALAAWQKAKLPAVADLLTAIASQSASEQWRKNEGQFIPHPATWLAGQRWNDFTSTARQSDHADF